MKIDRSSVKAFFEKGLSDEEIADKLQCDADSIRNIRSELRIKKISMDSWRHVGTKYPDEKTMIPTSANLSIPGEVFTKMFPEIVSNIHKRLKLLFKILPEYNEKTLTISLKIDSGIHCSDNGVKEIPKRDSVPGQGFIGVIPREPEYNDNSVSLPTLDKMKGG